MVKITYYGHSCFMVESDGYSIVLDPYTGVEGYPELSLKANEVCCSHEHFDHNFKEGVELINGAENPFKITEIASFHDPEGGKLRGSNAIRIFEAGGVKLAHLGDIGCELKPEEKELLKELDCIMVPVGGTFTIDAAGAKKLMDELNPRTIIPMHYRSEGRGIDVLKDVSEFTRLYDGGTRMIAKAGSTIVINHGTVGQQSEGVSNLVVMEPKLA